MILAKSSLSSLIRFGLGSRVSALYATFEIIWNYQKSHNMYNCGINLKRFWCLECKHSVSTLAFYEEY